MIKIPFNCNLQQTNILQMIRQCLQLILIITTREAAQIKTFNTWNCYYVWRAVKIINK